MDPTLSRRTVRLECVGCALWLKIWAYLAVHRSGSVLGPAPMLVLAKPLLSIASPYPTTQSTWCHSLSSLLGVIIMSASPACLIPHRSLFGRKMMDVSRNSAFFARAVRCGRKPRTLRPIGQVKGGHPRGTKKGSKMQSLNKESLLNN